MSGMGRRTVLATGGVAALALSAPGRARPTTGAIRLRPDREAMVAVPGGRVYVRVNGDLKAKRPPIVLLHGGPGSSHWYFLNATALADDRAVILYDQLDSGRSDMPGDPANWVVPRFVDELDAIRAHFGLDRWHVLGASWGGTVALEYGARHRDRLASLILQSPLISTGRWLADARRLKDSMPAGVRDLLDRCDTPDPALAVACQAATDAFYARYVRLHPPAPAIAAYRDALPRSFSPNIYTYMWGRAEFTATGTLADYDGTPLLRKLDGPRTLFVAGEHDEATPATVSAFARSVPGARFAEVAGAAHSIMNDNPAAFLAMLRPWLAEHDA
ncbi:proline iminopeptidase-family hydrolase [uncultured Sphingomonas sp.]|mgnify:CR=1 FL=1|uniref:proline iminopeptidase-family hydrolase n=1 Tax=uncultured Sphingomonas sp. TaxID=158754 RepID=UPI0025F1EAA9|nr:proline iminopeptidase-family hydrolase [uncultured Sphingomonas sp.]